MESAVSSPAVCPACGNIGGPGATFCAACGLRLADGSQPAVLLPVTRARDAWIRVRSAAVLYLVLLALVLGFGALDTGDWALELYVAADVVMLGAIVAFGWPLRRDILGLFRVPRMDALAWALLVLGPASLWLLNQGLVSMTRDLPGVLVSDPILELRLAGASTWTVVLLVCVSPSLVEEVAFRGVILETIRESFGERPAMVVVSILFSVLHLAMLSFVPLAGLALVLAVLRIRTGSLWPAIAGHALFNLAAVLSAT
jgi:membrane protease YdiL (CAAX protease family)